MEESQGGKREKSGRAEKRQTKKEVNKTKWKRKRKRGTVKDRDKKNGKEEKTEKGRAEAGL